MGSAPVFDQFPARGKTPSGLSVPELSGILEKCGSNSGLTLPNSDSGSFFANCFSYCYAPYPLQSARFPTLFGTCCFHMLHATLWLKLWSETSPTLFADGTSASAEEEAFPIVSWPSCTVTLKTGLDKPFLRCPQLKNWRAVNNMSRPLIPSPPLPRPHPAAPLRPPGRRNPPGPADPHGRRPPPPPVATPAGPG